MRTDSSEHVGDGVRGELAYWTEHVAAGVVPQLVVGGAGGVVRAVITWVTFRISWRPETVIKRAPVTRHLPVP